jgi:hypothetical protein
MSSALTEEEQQQIIAMKKVSQIFMTFHKTRH